MKILFLSSYANPATGSSTLFRLAEDMQKKGHEVLIVTTDPDAPSLPCVREIEPTFLEKIETSFIKLFLEKTHPFTYRGYSSRILQSISTFNPDVVNIQWTHGHIIPLSVILAVSKKYKTYWTFHDMWAFTGYSAYESDISGWQNGYQDLTLEKGKLSWNCKNKLLKDASITVITPSNWMKKKASQSPIFKNHPIVRIANGIDTEFFKPVTEQEKNYLREKYKIKKDALVLLFVGANLNDPRKGYSYLEKALTSIAEADELFAQKMSIVLVGKEKQALGNLPVTTHKVGSITDPEKLRDYYCMSDIFVLPSEADNLPSTAIEAISCGIPVIAFNAGGISDIIVEQATGLLAEPLSASSLASKIFVLGKDEQLRKKISMQARKFAVEHFSQHIQTENYLNQFKK